MKNEKKKKKSLNPETRTQWKKKEERTDKILVKRKKKNEKKRERTKEQWRRKEKKNGQKVRLTWLVGPPCMFNYQNAIGNWKHLKCVFSFHNSWLKNHIIEWWKQKLETKLLKSKQPFESWVPLFLSYELWKLEIQTPP